MERPFLLFMELGWGYNVPERFDWESRKPAMKDKLNSLPSSPGVYLMKDSHGGVIYVGKSKNLKQRVQSYFYKSKSHSNKVKRMVS